MKDRAMSLDLYLYTDTEEIASMSWLRNPFGLCQWAEDNFGGDGMLAFVCNQWAYDKCEEIDRAMFKRVVDEYWERIKQAPISYFWFNESQYNQFLKPHESYFIQDVLGGIAGRLQTIDNRKGIPISYFDKPDPPPSLDLKRKRNQSSTIKENYETWFHELVVFADKLQNQEYKFYCEN